MRNLGLISALLVLVLSGVPALADDGFKTPALAPGVLAAELGSAQAPLVIDVRAPVEYRIAHVPGAQNIAAEALPQHLDEIRRAHGIVLYCIAGKRTKTAERVLLDHGVTNVSHLTGGFSAWLDGGYPFTKGPTP